MSDAPDGRTARGSRLDTRAGLEVLEQLHAQLGPVDEDTRAVVALVVEDAGTVALGDVTLHDNGILEVPEKAAGLVVVTGEEVAAGGEVVGLRQFVCILPSGHEVGLYWTDDHGEPRAWSTADDPEGDAISLRPRDLTSNTARRALGLPSLVDVPPIRDLLARSWLLTVAGEALGRFDAPGGPHEVEPEDLAHVAAAPPIAALGEDPDWEEVHRAAVEGSLELGPFTVDLDHAAWLDPAGLAQVLDQTLPSTDDLLGSLEVLGGDLLAWAIDWLASRAWYMPR